MACGGHKAMTMEPMWLQWRHSDGSAGCGQCGDDSDAASPRESATVPIEGRRTQAAAVPTNVRMQPAAGALRRFLPAGLRKLLAMSGEVARRVENRRRP